MTEYYYLHCIMLCCFISECKADHLLKESKHKDSFSEALKLAMYMLISFCVFSSYLRSTMVVISQVSYLSIMILDITIY